MRRLVCKRFNWSINKIDGLIAFLLPVKVLELGGKGHVRCGPKVLSEDVIFKNFGRRVPVDELSDTA